MVADQPAPLLDTPARPRIAKMVIIAAVAVIPHVQRIIRFVFLFLSSFSSEPTIL